jgi:hypothetical protein
MLGRLEFVSGERNQSGMEKLYGLDVLRVQTDPEGLLGNYRLARAGAALRRGGAGRVLLPGTFHAWEMLARFGLRRVDPTPFLHFCAPKLALEGLRRRDMDPARSTVTLSGSRADSSMTRAAVRLCPRVRRLVISAPGGERLACQLREQFGIPVLPAEEPAHMEVNFHPGTECGNPHCMKLYGAAPDLAGGSVTFPALNGDEKGDIALLCALWEGGKLDAGGLKFT